MEDGDTESENASRVIQDFVFLCRKIGSINGYFCRYIINLVDKLISLSFLTEKTLVSVWFDVLCPSQQL